MHTVTEALFMVLRGQKQQIRGLGLPEGRGQDTSEPFSMLHPMSHPLLAESTCDMNLIYLLPWDKAVCSVQYMQPLKMIQIRAPGQLCRLSV